MSACVRERGFERQGFQHLSERDPCALMLRDSDLQEGIATLVRVFRLLLTLPVSLPARVLAAKAFTPVVRVFEQRHLTAVRRNIRHIFHFAAMQ